MRSHSADLSILFKNGLKEFTFSFIHLFRCLIVADSQSNCILIVGYLKGKSAISIVPLIQRSPEEFTGKHFLAKGYFVSTVGLDEDMVIEYVRS
ncbi:MAG: hypothetical protein GY753_16525 [Gammaproteobacteria bacterium]|nr:hypothetical protein [Gammaproteobacteria bacterium]